MKSRFSTLAPILALVFLASAGSAFKYGKEIEARAKAAKSEESAARADMELAEIAHAEVLALKESNEREREIAGKNAELAQGIATIMTLAKESGIKIGSVGSVGAGQQESNAIENIFEAVPMTAGKLHRADVAVKGEYASYEGFLSFFEELKRHGIAVQSATVRRSNFDATIRFMGT